MLADNMANTKFVFASFVFTVIAAGLSYTTAFILPTLSTEQIPGLHILTIVAFTGSSAVVSLLIGAVCLFISTQRIAKHHSVFSALRLFLLKYHRLYVGSRRLKGIRSTFQNPRKAQERLLQEIIAENKNTVYGRQYKIGEIASLNEFREKHPLTDYDRYEKFVERAAKGEKDVMTTKTKITRFATTSGTTGKSKLIPQDEDSTEKLFVTLGAIQRELFPGVHPMQSILRVHSNAAIRRSEGGIAITSATALEPFMVRNFDMYTPPGDGLLIGTLREAFYIDLLFALRDKELGSAIILFTPTLVDLMRFLEENWKELVQDLSSGTLNEDLTLSENVRASLLKSLEPGDPQRAMEVKTECEKGTDGIMKRLWPNMEFITCVDLAGLKESLQNSIAKGIEIHRAYYVSSEACPMGLNLWPFNDGAPEYVLTPSVVIYEFIKEEDMDQPHPASYFIDEVEVGQRYELVLSQEYGLYRFRFGDVIEVSGFHQNCPKVKVLYRKASLLNMAGEKVDQLIIKEAVNDALEMWKGQVNLTNYCVAESVLIPGSTGLRYVFFLELKSVPRDEDPLPDDLTEDILSQAIERGILERHSSYRNYRATDQIKPPEVHLTKPGAFTQLREYILSNSGATRAQFKMPLKLRTEGCVDVMLKNSINCE